MRISKIHLKGVGVFEEETIEFPEKKDPNKAEVHIFTGENGTGKSTLLYALSTINSDRKVVNQKNILDRFRSSESSVKIVTDNFDGFSYKPVNGLLDFHYNLELTSFEGYKYDLDWRKTNFATAFFAYSGYRQLTPFNVSKIEELDVSPLMDSLNFQKSINSENFIQWLVITSTKEALERNRLNAVSADFYKRSIDRISKVISEITGQKIKFHLEINPLVIKVSFNDKPLSFDVVPDGLKSIIAWVGDLLMRMDRMNLGSSYNNLFDAHFILFLDEIEVHLHPAWQRKILPVVQKLFKNAQIFISTHSPFVVGSVEGAYVHKLILKDGIAHAKPPRLTRTGESLSLILDEVFDIEDEFDLETEKELDAFYQLKEEILKGDVSHENDFIAQAQKLANKSEEIKDIVGREIRQVNRLANKQYAL